MDVLTPGQRSFNMSQIKSKNTKPELLIFEALKKKKIKFKKHFSIAGKPDVAFPKEKIAVFIDGEFWHGRYFSKIKSKLSEFWIKKITDNKKRDSRNRRLLKKEGWTVIRLWGDDIEKNGIREVNKILRALKTDSIKL